jgi:[ribosomal protein S18]-alanine N-acetyltransferase
MESRGADVSFRFRPLRWSDVRAMGGWHYETPYDFYNHGYFSMFLLVLLRPVSAFLGSEIFSVWSEAGKLVGNFSFTKYGTGVTLGLAVRPDLTGKGYGLAFVQAGMDFARQRYAPRFFRLDVAPFNQRAIKVYERAGFISSKKTSWMLTTHGMRTFLEMTREA